MMEDNRIPKLYMTNAPEGVIVDDYLNDHEFCMYIMHALQSRPNSRSLIGKTIQFFDAHNANQNNTETTEEK